MALLGALLMLVDAVLAPLLDFLQGAEQGAQLLHFMKHRFRGRAVPALHCGRGQASLSMLAHRAPAAQRGGHDRSQVGMVELFFDLVFVFAITQLARAAGTADTASARCIPVCFIGAWWLWIYTTWCTNWLNPASTSVRQLLFVLMLLALVMAAALPRAFADRGLVFALAYVAQHLLRSAYMVHAFGAGSGHGRNFIRIFAWLAVSGACWVLGGLSDPQSRLAWWTRRSPSSSWARSPLPHPGHGASTTTDWDVDPHHGRTLRPVRIIALGESLPITGATFAGLAWETSQLLAFLAAFVGAVAMWWLYFDTGSGRHPPLRTCGGSRPGGAAGYTYLHIPIVADHPVRRGDELVLVHPPRQQRRDHGDPGRPLLYLLGNGLFKWVTNRRRLPPVSHLAGMGMLLALAPFAFGHAFSALALAGLTSGTLVLVALWEWRSLQRA
jgi:low temperature requirement protein LtrA